MVELREMTEGEVETFLEASIANYAAEKVRAGQWREGMALRAARATVERLLPDGLATPGHRLLAIVAEGEVVGSLWLAEIEEGGERDGFVYDLAVDESRRGRGIGRGALAALDDFARAQGLRSIGLNVFVHNEGARRLYERSGYRVTAHAMKKTL